MSIGPALLLVLIAIVAVATAVGYAETSSGPTSYACMSISHQSGQVKVTTTGLLHYVKSEYYVSCNEGSSLPTSQYKTSCLTISPQTIPATIGVGASTEYYYLSATGGTITLVGAPPPTNGTEIITPASISLQIAC